MWPPVTSLAYHLKSSILTLITMWHCSNWWPMGIDFPSDNTSNAVLTFCITLDIASAHRVLPFLASRVRACSTFLRSCMPNLWLFFRYLVCCLLLLAIVLSLYLSACLTHQLTAGSWSITCATANTTVCTGWYSFHSDNSSHEVEASFH